MEGDQQWSQGGEKSRGTMQWQRVGGEGKRRQGGREVVRWGT